MFFYILTIAVAIAVLISIVGNARNRLGFAEAFGYAFLTALVASLCSTLLFCVVAATIGSVPATKVHLNTESYTIAENSKFDATDNKLNFVYLKDGKLENYNSYVAELHFSKDSGKTVQIDVTDNYYPGWAPFPYSTTRSATLR